MDQSQRKVPIKDSCRTIIIGSTMEGKGKAGAKARETDSYPAFLHPVLSSSRPKCRPTNPLSSPRFHRSLPLCQVQNQLKFLPFNQPLALPEFLRTCHPSNLQTSRPALRLVCQHKTRPSRPRSHQLLYQHHHPHHCLQRLNPHRCLRRLGLHFLRHPCKSLLNNRHRREELHQ